MRFSYSIFLAMILCSHKPTLTAVTACTGLKKKIEMQKILVPLKKKSDNVGVSRSYSMETAVQFLNYSCRLQRMMMTWILILVWRNGALAGSLETVSFGWDMWNVRHLNMPLTRGRSCVINHHHFFCMDSFLVMCMFFIHSLHSDQHFAMLYCWVLKNVAPCCNVC